jgi:hypothetical protein
MLPTHVLVENVVLPHAPSAFLSCVALDRQAHRELTHFPTMLRALVNARGAPDAMRCVAENGRADFANALCDRFGDDADFRNDADTYARAAAEGGHKEIVELLCDRFAGDDRFRGGVDVYAKFAAKRGHKDVLKLLCDTV